MCEPQPVLGVRGALLPHTYPVSGQRSILRTLPLAGLSRVWAPAVGLALLFSPGVLPLTACDSILPIQFLKLRLLLSQVEGTVRPEGGGSKVHPNCQPLRAVPGPADTSDRGGALAFSEEKGAQGWAASGGPDLSGAWRSRGSGLCGPGLPSAFAFLNRPSGPGPNWLRF